MALSFRERVKQKAQEAEYSGGSDTLRLRSGVSFFKPKKGKNEIRVVPFVMTGKNMEDIDKGELWFRMQILKHFSIGAENKSVICPRTIGKKCPICEHRSALIAQGKDKQDDEVKALAPKKRDIFNVIDLSEDDSTVHVWEVSNYNFGRKLEEEIREADDEDVAAQFADPKDGAILTIRMVEKSIGGNKYLETSRVDFTPSDPLDQEVIDQAIPFDQCLVVKGYDELNRMLFDLEEEDMASDAVSDPVVEEEEIHPRESRHKKREAVQAKGVANEEESATSKAPKKEAKPSEKASAKKPAKAESVQEAPNTTPSEDGMVCPFGGTFGADCDSEKMLKHCEQCDVWSECRDRADALPF